MTLDLSMDKSLNGDGETNGLTLSQSYPNPTSGATTVEYSLPKAVFVEMEISNVQGEILAHILSRKEEAGIHTANFDVSKLASGTYILTLRTELGSIHKNLTVVK